jgi:hypothetical protein
MCLNNMDIIMIKIKKLLLASLVTASILPQTVLANDDVSFIPRAWIGVSDYSFKQGERAGALPGGNDFPKVEFDVTFIMLGIGLTTAYDRFYLDLSYQDSTDESDDFSGSAGGISFSEKLSGDRRDYAATFGMRVLDNRGNVYVGYKNGKSAASGNVGTKLSFEEDGFFVGASYGWVIADAGLLSINAAYADLDGNLNEQPGPGYPAGLSMDADSEATGLSYGVSWNGKISDQMGYSISFDANDYEFDHIRDSSTSVPLPDKIEETLYTGKVSISYRF